MKFERKHPDELELNLTPLIDVVFLLLIFFMVSTTFQKESEISLQLPRATQDPVDKPLESIEVVINAAGKFFVNDQELVQHDVKALQAALHQITNGQRDVPLTIRADAQTPHQAVVVAMDAAAQLGMLRMSIATSHSPK
ncbi:MAG: biopolymer transporter ExbD [Granulosicoccaceae bacterium]